MAGVDDDDNGCVPDEIGVGGSANAGALPDLIGSLVYSWAFVSGSYHVASVIDRALVCGIYLASFSFRFCRLRRFSCAGEVLISFGVMELRWLHYRIPPSGHMSFRSLA